MVWYPGYEVRADDTVPGFFLKYEVYFGVVCHRPG